MSHDKESNDWEVQAVVIDTGSSMVKCGLSGDEGPRASFPNIHGVPKSVGMGMFGVTKDYFIGDEAQMKRGILKIRYPLVHSWGDPPHWKYLERVWKHSFNNEIRGIAPYDHPVIMSDLKTELDDPTTMKHHADKLCEIMFETFEIPSLYVMNSSVSSLYAYGVTSGLTLEIGEECRVVPVLESVPIHSAVRKLSVGGVDIRDYLYKILAERGYDFSTAAEREIVRDIKEKLCFVSEDYEKDLLDSETSGKWEHDYELPDQAKITIGNERFRCCEILFRPSFLGKEEMGLMEQVYGSVNDLNSIMERGDESYEDIYGLRSEIFKRKVKDVFGKTTKMYFSGGGTMFEGLKERMEGEIAKTKPVKGKEEEEKKKIEIVGCAAQRKFHSWIGMAIYSSVFGSKNRYKSFVSAEEYEDFGSSILLKKCRSSCHVYYASNRVVWSERNHKLHSKDFRECVRTLIGCCFSKRSELYVVPREVIDQILQFLGRDAKSDEIISKEIKRIKWY